MICFRCGEKNPDSYRFCGMCGGPLQATKGTHVSDPEPSAPPVEQQKPTPSVESRSENFPFSRAEKIAKPAATETVAPIGGPSLLGLNEPSMDSLREKAFSSAEETYFEPEVQRPAWMRVFVTLVILGGLAAAGWWGYTNYVQPPSAANSSDAKQDASATSAPAVSVPAKKESATAATPTPLPTEPAMPVESNTAETAKPDVTAPKKAEDQPAGDTTAAASSKTEGKLVEPSQKASEKPAEAPAEQTEVPVKPATSVVAKKATPAEEKPVKPPPATAAVASNDGEASFRRGEAYLYGRGVAENCDQAIKYLKSASDKSHAKARSAFGTMYATGHCVTRDLPTSYRWFALALRIDPNNQILEKDLSAVWNQMTPPERQLATKPSSQ